VLTIAFHLGYADFTHAQTCSCGGAPLLGALEIAATPVGSWQLGLTYEYNDISDVVSGSRRLENDGPRQATHSALFEITHGLTRSVSATGLLTLIQKERKTGERLLTRGIGDGLVLVKYNVMLPVAFRQREMAVGVGVKIPFGPSRLTLSNGALIPADMQPGSGTWDGILWGHAAQGFLKVPVHVFVTSSYRLTGIDQRYGTGRKRYHFGNELMASFGIGYRTGELFDYTLMIRFRSTAADRFGDADLPNTGGKWVYLVPGLNVKLWNDLSIRLSGQLPVYRDLNGAIQLTTKYTASLSMYYNIGNSLWPAKL